MSKLPPISPQTIIDVVFSATACTSSDEKSNKMGTLLFSNFLENLKKEHKDDSVAINYLNNLIPILGSTIRAFNVEKSNYFNKIMPREKLKQGEIDEVNTHLRSWPILSFIKASNNWATNSFNIVFVLLGTMFGLYASKEKISTEINYKLIIAILIILISTSVFVIIGVSITRLIRRRQVNNIVKQSTKDLDKIWEESYKKYETSLFDCLVGAIRAQEQFYPEIKTFSDGHLFPREDFPYMPPSNLNELTPSALTTSEIIDKLNSIIKSRISVQPGFDKIKWLKDICNTK